MLFFGMNYFDRQDYRDIKTAATTLVMIAFSCHSDLHDGLKNLHSLLKNTLEVNRINLCKSLIVWVFSFPLLLLSFILKDAELSSKLHLKPV